MRGRTILGLSFIAIGLLVWLIPFVRLQYSSWTPLREPFDFAKPGTLSREFRINVKGSYSLRIRCRQAGGLTNAPLGSVNWRNSPPLPTVLQLRLLRETRVVSETTIRELIPSGTEAAERLLYFQMTSFDLRETGRYGLSIENQAPIPKLDGAHPELEIQCSRAIWKQRSVYALVGLMAGCVFVVTGLLMLVATWIAHKVEYADFD